MAEASIVNGHLTIPRCLSRDMGQKHVPHYSLDEAGWGNRFMDNMISLLGLKRVAEILQRRIGKAVASGRHEEVIAELVEELVFRLLDYDLAHSLRMTQSLREQICVAVAKLILHLCRATPIFTFPSLSLDQEEANNLSGMRSPTGGAGAVINPFVMRR